MVRPHRHCPFHERLRMVLANVLERRFDWIMGFDLDECLLYRVFICLKREELMRKLLLTSLTAIGLAVSASASMAQMSLVCRGNNPSEERWGSGTSRR